jgi:hypothetical protein
VAVPVAVKLNVEFVTVLAPSSGGRHPVELLATVIDVC